METYGDNAGSGIEEPRSSGRLDQSPNRRQFLSLTAAGLSAVAVASCSSSGSSDRGGTATAPASSDVTSPTSALDSVANEGPRLGRTIGVNTHYGSYGPVNHEALARLANAGVAFIRNDITWDAVETELGVYDFAGSGYDELVETCESLGLEILFILDYGNALYGDPDTVTDAPGRDAFAAFAGAAADRYGGGGHRWEIWNEPNLGAFTPELYAELVRSTVPALRAADPDAHVAVGSLVFGALSLAAEAAGLGLNGAAFLEQLAATGALGLADEVTIHLYRSDAPETAVADIDLARDILQRAGIPLPVSSGEWGYATYDPSAEPTGINYLAAVSPERQAGYITRMLLTNFNHEVPSSVVFKDVDTRDGDPGDMEHHFGLLGPQLDAKPSYVALSNMTALLGNAGPPVIVPLGPGEHALRFERSDDTPVVALWAEQEATWLLRSDDPDDVRILTREGNDMTPTDIELGTLITIGPDEGPIYAVGDLEVTTSG